ncbi:MAG TPA: sigma-E factor regulatory protein RseB domain-containing protein [Vicinamibacterales bacterium]|jgi:hypothetical protein
MKVLLAWVTGVWLFGAAPVSAAPPALRGLGVDETLEGAPVLAPALDLAGATTAGLPVFVRLLVRADRLGVDPAMLQRLDARLEVYARRRIPVVLTLVDPPLDAAAIEAWRPRLRALAERCRGRVVGWQLGDRLDAADATRPQPYAYLVKFAAVQIRSIDSAALILQGSVVDEGTGGQAAAAWQAHLYSEDVAAYLDALPVGYPSGGRDAASRTADDTSAAVLSALETVSAKDDPSAVLGITGMTLGPDAAAGARLLLRSHLSRLGTRATFTTCTAPVEVVAAALKTAAAVKDVLADDVVTLDDRASSLRLSAGGQDVTETAPHRLLYNMTTFATYLLCWTSGQPTGPLEVSLHLPTAAPIAIRDAAAGTVTKVTDARRDEAAKTTTTRITPTDRPLLLDFNYGAEDAYALRTDAHERALPTVDEIIFRHQQAQAAQSALVTNYTAHARIDMHFRPSATDSGYDVVTENRFFVDATSFEWAEQSFSLNGTRWGRNRPPFPLLQPEKVLAVPLTLRLNRDYVYHLEGTEAVNGRRCYVVKFDPIDDAQSRYRGKVWIDTESFVRLKVQAVQTRLGAPVVSNEEVQYYEPVAQAGGQTLYLFNRLVARQIFLIAGRNLLVEKQVAFSDFRVNDPAFVDERLRARAGDEVMYRDTDRGIRFLVKRGTDRVVSDEMTTGARAFAAGAVFDPTFDFPLPIVGINYLNFNLLDRDIQFALVFGGVLAIGNVQKAKIGGTKFDVSLDFFGLAVSGNDQVFDGQGERKDERVRSRPASVGVNLGYQATDFQKLTLSSHAQYDKYLDAPGKTSADFVLPVTTVTLNLGANYEYRRNGYSLLAGWSYSRRGDWQRWGYGDEYDPAARTYTKYSLGLSKDFFVNAFSKLHLNGAYYGGQRQDRFSMYRFGIYDETKMRGVPSAGVRFADLAMARAQFSFNLFNQYRLDLFLDQAWGRTTSRHAWDPVTGIGTELSLRAPMGTLLKLGVGKGFLPQIYRGSGSMVAEVTVLKPL